MKTKTSYFYIQAFSLLKSNKTPDFIKPFYQSVSEAAGLAPSLEDSCELYNCAVCLESLTEKSPRQLTCLHTFCLPCLENLPVTMYQIECPTCRQYTQLKNGIVYDLPVNFSIIQMKEHMQKLLIQRDSVCHLCKAIIAEHKCKDCTHLLCWSCIERHNSLEQFKDHSIVPVCSKHPQGIVSHVCLRCVEPVCTLCILTHHSEHEKDVHIWKTALPSVQAKIDEWHQQAKETLEVITNAKDRSVQKMAQTDKFKERIQEMIDQYSEKLEEAKQIMSMIEAHDKNREEIIKHCNDQIEKYDHLVKKLTNVELKPDIVQRLKIEVGKKLNVFASFFPVYEKFTTNSNLLGIHMNHPKEDWFCSDFDTIEEDQTLQHSNVRKMQLTKPVQLVAMDQNHALVADSELPQILKSRQQRKRHSTL